MRATPARRQFTLDDYWSVEQESRLRHEFLHGDIYAMAGGRPRHDEVASNLQGALFAALRATPCRPLGSDQRIRVSSEEYTYPDLSVFCGPVELAPGSPPDTATNPVLLVEVLSDGTRDYDRTDKLAMYQRVPSVRAVLLVEPEEVRVTLWARGEGGWTSTEHTDPAGELSLLGVSVSLADVYARTVTRA